MGWGLIAWVGGWLLWVCWGLGLQTPGGVLPCSVLPPALRLPSTTPLAYVILHTPTHCSCEGCSSLRELPASLAAALPLRSLNLLHTGVLHLPLATGVRLIWKEKAAAGSKENEDEEDEEEAAATAANASSYLRHLTKLRWGTSEWEQVAGGSATARRWVGANGALSDGAALPDLAPLLQASGLQELQLAHVPAATDVQLAALRQRLPGLARLQVNSAVLLG